MEQDKIAADALKILNDAITQPPPNDPNQFTDLEIQTIVDLELRKRPIFDPSKTFCSDANLDRVEAIHEFLCTMPQSEARDHLVFCYHLLNSGIIENGKLKKRLREFAEDKVREHFKSNQLNFRRHQLG